MGLIFYKLHIAENTVSVPNNLLYLQKEFERYALKQWWRSLFQSGGGSKCTSKKYEKIV